MPSVGQPRNGLSPTIDRPKDPRGGGFATKLGNLKHEGPALLISLTDSSPNFTTGDSDVFSAPVLVIVKVHTSAAITRVEDVFLLVDTRNKHAFVHREDVLSHFTGEEIGADDLNRRPVARGVGQLVDSARATLKQDISTLSQGGTRCRVGELLRCLGVEVEGMESVFIFPFELVRSVREGHGGCIERVE